PIGDMLTTLHWLLPYVSLIVVLKRKIVKFHNQELLGSKVLKPKIRLWWHLNNSFIVAITQVVSILKGNETNSKTHTPLK
ncbi:hypothetical protein NQ272_26945, partial [Escherichia coli]|nr:hypothetical protein [Escherichia coli]